MLSVPFLLENHQTWSGRDGVDPRLNQWVSGSVGKGLGKGGVIQEPGQRTGGALTVTDCPRVAADHRPQQNGP